MKYLSRAAATLLAALVVGAGAMAELKAQPAESRPEPASQIKLAQAEGATNGGPLSRVPQARRRQAEDALRQGRLRSAERLFREAITLGESRGTPVDLDAHAGLGLVLLRLDRPDEAAKEFEFVLAANPNHWPATYGQARLLLARGKWDEAKGLLDHGVGLKRAAEGEDDYHHGMALYYAGLGSAAEAEQEIQRALYIDPSNPEHVELFSAIYAQNGNSTAITALKQAVSKVGEDTSAPLLSELGRLLERDQLFNDARDRYVAALAADSTYAPALKQLADLLKLAKQPAPAAGIYARYLELEPTDIGVMLALSQMYLDLGQGDPAYEVARNAFNVDSTRIDVLRAYVRAGLKSSNPGVKAAAAARLTTSSSDAAWSAEDWLALAEQQRESKQFAAARVNIQRAARLSADLPQIPFQLGMIEMNEGNYGEAVTQLQHAIELKGDSPAYRLNLGIALAALKRTDEALASMRRAIEINPQYTTGRLTLAQTLAGMDQVPAAEEQYRAILGYDAANARALRGLGASQLRRGAFAEAARYYRTATDSDPSSAEGWAGLGMSALGLNDLAAAEDALKKAKSIDPANATVKKGVELLDRALGNEGGD